MSPAEEKPQMLAHHVYFTLHDPSPPARQKLVEACRKYLSGHPGQVWFAVGTLAAELKREVNDRDFDVALAVVFHSRADHDRYQQAERHLQFIAQNKATWKQVRVFDSCLDATSLDSE
jgi:hypothetical protein